MCKQQLIKITHTKCQRDPIEKTTSKSKNAVYRVLIWLTDRFVETAAQRWISRGGADIGDMGRPDRKRALW